MKVAVCDDNREFCEKERTTIKDVFKQYFQGEDCQVDIYNDGQTIISNYSDNAYDMVFLDLELGDENGFDIAEQIVLMNNDAIIIFVTSHENLVYEAFRFRPLGYIVKDRFDREFTRMMVKIVDKLIKMRQVIELGGEKFYVDRVVSIATQKRKICVKSLKGEILLADSYTRHVAELEKYGFVQSSKGVLINMKYIKSIDEDNDVFVMYNNERVPISRRRKKDVIEEYRKFMFDNNRKETGRMDINNKVLTSLILRVKNKGVIFIMDKISKLMGDNIIHAIKMVLLVGAGAAVYIMTYYGINSWVIMELMIIIAILIVQYIEQITIKVMLEISLINCIGIAILSANQADIIAICIVYLIVELYMFVVYLSAVIIKYRELDNLEMMFIQICVSSVLAGLFFGTGIYDTYNYGVETAGILIVTVLTFEIIGHWMQDFFNRTEEINKRIEYANEQFEVERVQKMYEESRKLRHDLKQCLTSAIGYMDDNNYDKAEDFLKNIMSEKINSYAYRKYCDNRTLNYILNDKNDKCEKQNIAFTCMVLGQVGLIDDIDMCILAGNVIDNAIEAAAKCSDPYVNVEITSRGGIFMDVENPVKETFLNRKNPFLTTKLDKNNHGIGTKSIRDIVAKYNGEIRYEEKEGKVTCHIFLSTKYVKKDKE